MLERTRPDAGRGSEIPVPEPELTPDELVARAEALRPLLREQQEEAERRGHPSEEVHRAFVRAGFSRILLPRRFGGYEFDVPTFFRTMVEISRGDPGTGWYLTLASSHALVVASHFSEGAQREMFGPDGDFRAPHRAVPGGTAVPTGDGYRVSGRWDYASGVPYATWFLGTATLPADDPAQAPNVVVAVPRREFSMLDDWGGDAFLGMNASGSNTVVVEDAHRPSEFVVPMDWFDPATPTPGVELHGNPMYLGRVGGLYHSSLVITQVGAAKAALDEFREIITTKRTLFPPRVLRATHHDYQRSYGLAMGMTDAAEAILMRVGQLYMEHVRAWADHGEPFTVERDARLWGAAQQAGGLATDAVQLLFEAGSSSAARRGQRLQRYLRDAAMYRSHLSAQQGDLASTFARVYLGLADKLI